MATRAIRFGPAVLGILVLLSADALPQELISGQNINMVSGTKWPTGDPYLQRQNEPTIAVSSRNGLHLMAGSNDYRTVDLPGLPEGKTIGDSWISAYFSTDGGGRWSSTLLPGFPQDDSPEGLASPLKQAGYEASADPVIRAGTHGLFYYSGIAFTRGDAPRSAGFVATYMDLNNDERTFVDLNDNGRMDAEERISPIHYVRTTLFDQNEDGTSFIDKPWIAVDKPRGASNTVITVNTDDGPVTQLVECGNVYAAYARIQGDGTAAISSQIMFSRSNDCAASFNPPIQLSAPNTINQGAAVAVDPSSGRIQVAWRQFENATLNCTRSAFYWHQNLEAWPVDEIEIAGTVVRKAEIGEFLDELIEDDDSFREVVDKVVWYGLFRQVLAARLNALSGADTSVIDETLGEAEAWLLDHPPGTRLSRSDKWSAARLWATLLYYNIGGIGPGSCEALSETGLSGLHPNAIMVVTSIDGGETFSAPVAATGADYSPFEQGTTEFSFRTTGYPTMTFDDQGRSYIAYSTRGVAIPDDDPVGGDARIVVTTSLDGTNWTTPQPIDEPSQPGHQLMPALEFSRGRVFLLYYDFRADALGVSSRFIVDVEIEGTTLRHTTDVRAAHAIPADVPVFTDYSVLDSSTQTSRYPYLILGAEPNEFSQQIQYNPPNLPMFKGGTVPFFGDYIDLAAQRFYFDETASSWEYDSLGNRGAPVVHAVWTDNRDVVGPPPSVPGDEDPPGWTDYVPPLPDGEEAGRVSRFDPSKTVPVCTDGTADLTKMRNQNVYTSRLTQGLAVAIPGNNRELGTIQRAFVLYVQNTTDEQKRFLLDIQSTPTGVIASFEQFDATVTTTVEVVEPYSSRSTPVFVTSLPSKPRASVNIDIMEVDASGNPISGGLAATATINPDPTAPVPTDGNLLGEETYTPAVFNPAIFNPAVFNASLGSDEQIGIYNPAIFNPAVFNTPEDAGFIEAALVQLSLLNPAVFNPAIFNPAIFNPAVFNPAVFNPAVFNPAVFNPAVFNPAIFNPAVFNPAIFNPAVAGDDSIDNSSMVETSVVVENQGNATSAYSFNVDLDLEAPPDAFLFQLMVYRTYLVPSAEGCDVTETVEQELLVSELSANVNGDLFNPDSTSFYLAPGDHAIATLRILPNPDAAGGPGDPSTINTLDELAPALSVVPRAVDTEDLADGITQPSPVIVGSAGVPAVLSIVAGDGQVAHAAESVAVDPTVRVTDAAGDPLNGVPVTFTVTSGGGSVAGGQSVTGTDGQASIPWTLGPSVGVQSMEATVAGLGPAAFSATRVEIAGQLLDPAGDSGFGNPDIVAATVAVVGTDLLVDIRFTPAEFDDQTRSSVLLDTDQNTATGARGVNNSLDDQTLIGPDYRISLGSLRHRGVSGGQVSCFCNPSIREQLLFIGFVDVTFHEDGMSAFVPLAMLGGDDGIVNFKAHVTTELALNTTTGILDYVSDIGLAPGVTSHAARIDSVTLSTTSMVIGGGLVPYTVTISNLTEAPISRLILQGLAVQPGVARAAGGRDVNCGPSPGVLPPGSCSFSFTFNPSNSTGGSGTLTAGTATAVFELELFNGVDIRTIDRLEIPITLLDP